VQAFPHAFEYDVSLQMRVMPQVESFRFGDYATR
jgi:hypothetical protein